MYKKTKLFIKEMLQQQVMPGCNVAFVSQESQEILTYGYQSYAKDKPMQKNNLFDLASLTKVIGTTVVILQLLEQSKLALTTPVQKFLSIKDDKLQIKHLLTHTSDFQGYIPNRNKLNNIDLTNALLWQMQPGINLGKKVKYSDINFLYLGWIAEKIYQSNIQSIINKQVLTKLDANNFTFNPQKVSCVPTEGSLQGIVHDPKAQVLKKHCGSAGLFGTITDVVDFCQIFLNNGKTKSGRKLLQSKTIAMLNQSYTPVGEQQRSLGFVYDHGFLTHTGYTGTYLAFNLQTKEIFVFLSNRIQPIDDKQRYLKYRDELIATYLNDKRA